MNVASLRQQILELQAQLRVLHETSARIITAQEAQIESLKSENKLLRQKLDAFARRFFGRKSEELSTAHLELLLSGLERSEPAAPAAPTFPPSAPVRKGKGSCRIRTPEDLEVVRNVIEPREVQAEPEKWREVGQEVSRQLDYQPGKFFWLETVRPERQRRALAGADGALGLRAGVLPGLRLRVRAQLHPPVGFGAHGLVQETRCGRTAALLWDSRWELSHVGPARSGLFSRLRLKAVGQPRLTKLQSACRAPQKS